MSWERRSTEEVSVDLILMDSEVSDVSWVMGQLEKVGMVSRLDHDDVNLVCGRGNKELLVFFMHL